MYDVIVIGARCGGSPTAMLLARKGYRVLLVDKAAFPSDTISTSYIWQPGVACLRHWNLLDKVAASNCPPAQEFKFDLGEFALAGSPPAAEGVHEAYCVRRTVLDKILADAAVEAGTELRERFSVQELVCENGRVTGIRGRSSNGAAISEAGRLVVGADGVHSLVARTVNASRYQEKPPLTCWYYSFWSGVPLEKVEAYPRDGRWIVAVRTNNGLTLVIVAWTNKEFSKFRANLESNFLATLREHTPDLADRVQAGKREERFMGTADLPNFFRKPYGDGWALVGDAGYHKDPVAAQGITDAFRHAELLTEAIDAGFSGRQPLRDALAKYEQNRNQDVTPRYELTCNFATLAPLSPDMRALFRALKDNRVDTSQFFGTLAGTVAVSEFFAPENIGRILGSAA